MKAFQNSIDLRSFSAGRDHHGVSLYLDALTSFKDYYEIIDMASRFFPREPVEELSKSSFNRDVWTLVLNSLFVASLETTSVCFYERAGGLYARQIPFSGQNLIFAIWASLMVGNAGDPVTDGFENRTD